MTIEEKSKECGETCIDDDPVNPFAAIARVEGRDAFKRGAQWMLEKAKLWLIKNLKYTDDISNFQKDMEE